MMGLSLGVDTCPERMDAAALRPPRIGTAVEFCPRMVVEFCPRMVVEFCPRMVVGSMKTEVETAVLTMRRFWCTRKKIRDRTLFLLFFLPESLFVASGIQAAVGTCPERMEAVVALEAVVAYEYYFHIEYPLNRTTFSFYLFFYPLFYIYLVDSFFSLDTWPRLRTMERTNMGNSEAAEPVPSGAGVTLEAVLALVDAL